MSGHLPGENDPLPRQALDNLSWVNGLSERAAERDELLKAALHLMGVESDGRWVVYADEFEDLIREHLLPVVRRLVEEDAAWEAEQMRE